MTLAESDQPVHKILLNAVVDAQGNGNGVLTLDLTPPAPVDEFGFDIAFPAAKDIKLDCKLQFVKRTIKHYHGWARPGRPEEEAKPYDVEWMLYSITGPKITSSLFLSVQTDSYFHSGRLLVQGMDARVKHMLPLVLQPQPEPCHPGCFPAGTRVLIPGGTAAIETLRVSDAVVTVDHDGRQAVKSIERLFTVKNLLLEVRTTGGHLVTTMTQPLALEKGGFREAGKLQPGDRILRWHNGQRHAVVVNEVTPADREAQVYNLVLGQPTTFIANDLHRQRPSSPTTFLARRKPTVTLAVP
ncbi:MAG: 3-dehydroquinate synthase [Planctomyces sp.]|nr:3-dehydroquinate synthase [Planctomyces sp.]